MPLGQASVAVVPQNKYGKTPTDPCWAFLCTKFDLDAWNEEAERQLRFAQQEGVNVADLMAIELDSSVTLPPWKDLRKSIDKAASVAQQAAQRREEAKQPVPPPTPEPPTEWWTWPTIPWPSWPTIPKMPSFDISWIWLLLLGGAALALGKEKRRR